MPHSPVPITVAINILYSTHHSDSNPMDYVPALLWFFRMHLVLYSIYVIQKHVANVICTSELFYTMHNLNASPTGLLTRPVSVNVLSISNWKRLQRILCFCTALSTYKNAYIVACKTHYTTSVQINHQLDVTICPVLLLDIYLQLTHVSGVLTPIIRSSTTAVAAFVFTFGAWW